MKSKTSITLSTPVLNELDRLAENQNQNRSEIIEHAVVEFLKNRAREARDKKDRRILDSNFEALNREASDVLNYQIEK